MFSITHPTPSSPTTCQVTVFGTFVRMFGGRAFRCPGYIAADDRQVAVSEPERQTVTVLSWPHGTRLQRVSLQGPWYSSLHRQLAAVCILPSGRVAVVDVYANTLSVVDVDSGTEVVSMPGDYLGVALCGCVAVCAGCGERQASGDVDAIVVVDGERGELR